MTVESIAEILESELKEAVEVKNEKSLHRYIMLLSENIVSKQKHSDEYNSLKSDIGEMLMFMRERFESTDRRFEEMQNSMDKRFESVDKRFEDIQNSMDKRFESVDKRFEAVDRRFDDMNQRFSMMFRFITVGFVVLATMMSVFQFLA